MPEPVLVTRAFGQVGSATVRQLLDDGRPVVATDIDTRANRAAAAQTPRIDTRWADLTDAESVRALVTAVNLSAIIHLAAVIPPFCYARPRLARGVNVGATAALADAAAALKRPPRLLLASSVATYGVRNPYQVNDVLTADTPLSPYDVYGTHKVEAEEIVRAAPLDWVVLRLGAVVNAGISLGIDLDLIYFEGLLPTDGRVHTVEVRDVARAFIAATSADVAGETLLIGGDSTHQQRQGHLGPATAAAMGLKGALPKGRPGDPADPTGWFATDWMDTTRAQEALGFQRYSWFDVMRETAKRAGWRRPLLAAVAPIAHVYLRSRSPYRSRPGRYADPWGAVAAKWGDPRP